MELSDKEQKKSRRRGAFNIRRCLSVSTRKRLDPLGSIPEGKHLSRLSWLRKA